MSAANQEVIHAYRHLYRAALRAVQYSKPARFAARDTLREAFREPGASLRPEPVRRTVWFLKQAAREAGIEHRIVRNLLRTAWARRRDASVPWATVVRRGERKEDKIKETAYKHYEMTIAMLNHTMGLCLR